MIVKNIFFLIFIFVVLFMQYSVIAEIKHEKATFAGGCFWCMEQPFEEYEGVIDVLSGYTGGHKENPTYEEVTSESTGHLEAVQVIYDPSKIGYSELLDIFWKQINPTDSGGQFVDRGLQYKTAIFYHNEKQRQLAEISKEQLNKSGKYNRPIVTEIREAARFYKAEEYHQDFYKQCPVRYKTYRQGSGRDLFLERIWGKKMNINPQKSTEDFEKPTDTELKRKLTPLQYKITQKNGTEKPFENEYLDNKKEGIYVDIVSGEPLFSSLDKYDSGTGWPSFTRPLDKEKIVEVQDRALFTMRTELRSKHADSHIGHVFEDGPQPTGLRYCINSAALRFIHKDDLEKEGYGEYKKLFEK